MIVLFVSMLASRIKNQGIISDYENSSTDDTLSLSKTGFW